MGGTQRKTQVHDLLIAAANELELANDDLKPWDYGWCKADYRRSPDARLSGPSGTLRMSAEGVSYYETAVELLLGEESVRLRWDAKQLWSIVGSLVVFLWTSGASPDKAERQVARLRRAAPSTVLMPAANIRWEGPPIVIGDAVVIGEWDDPEFAAAVSALRGVPSDHEAIAAYLSSQPHHRPMTGFATVVAAQRSMAFQQAAKLLEQVCDIALLLVEDKGRYGLYSVRGSWNRPGVRGLVLDRSTIESVFASSENSVELASQPLVIDEIGKSSTVRWYSSDPVPLARLLGDVNLARDLEAVLNAPSEVAARVRLAARWYAESFWATEPDDSVLALGVSLDALIGAKSGLPGRVMRDRYALLDAAPVGRPERAKRYDEIFGVRSAVAHGGTSSRVSESGFVRKIQGDVTWAARRLLCVEKAFGEDLANNLDRLFDQLRWGMIDWPSDAEQ